MAKHTLKILFNILPFESRCYFLGNSNNLPSFNPIQNGPFRDCSRMRGKKVPLPKICNAYSTVMKLGTVNMVAISMMSAKLATLGLLEIKVF